jgi:hypothetical protein
MKTQQEILDSLIWVTLPDPNNFLKIKETLTRIGIASRRDNTLYQSCHILHKQGRYAIVHFKELFALDGKPTDFIEEDRARRNTIACLLEEWNLLTIVNKEVATSPKALMNQIKVIPFKDKGNWNLVAKYTVGRSNKE